jgi:hypothetical protein
MQLMKHKSDGNYLAPMAKAGQSSGRDEFESLGKELENT